MFLLTQVLEVDPDLVHPPGVGAAHHHARVPVVAQTLELSVALLAPLLAPLLPLLAPLLTPLLALLLAPLLAPLLAMSRHAADSDLVADDLDALAALHQAPVTQYIKHFWIILLRSARDIAWPLHNAYSHYSLPPPPLDSWAELEPS